MSLWLLLLVLLLGSLLSAALLYVVLRRLANREPYVSFLRLRSRQKVRFFRLLVTDKRVPRRVKALPFLVLPYLALPFDLIPDFVPVIGYLDDVAIVLGAFALVIHFTPRPVIDDLFRLAALPEA